MIQKINNTLIKQGVAGVFLYHKSEKNEQEIQGR